MKILIIDNYDSFTYNLVHYVEQFVEKVDIVRNDEISDHDILQYDALIISPGPGLPKDAGLCLEVIQKFSGQIPILGICLGHQAIAEAFGGKLKNLDEPIHGISLTTIITETEDILFKGIVKKFDSGRYHSWVIDPDYFPQCLNITSVDQNNNIMSISHRVHNTKGMQFHPESILTEKGWLILKNWIENCKE